MVNVDIHFKEIREKMLMVMIIYHIDVDVENKKENVIIEK